MVAERLLVAYVSVLTHDNGGRRLFHLPAGLGDLIPELFDLLSFNIIEKLPHTGR